MATSKEKTALKGLEREYAKRPRFASSQEQSEAASRTLSAYIQLLQTDECGRWVTDSVSESCDEKLR
jgi:hypothetical protein